MVEIEQTNVRVPTNAKASLVRIAKRLRDEPAFLHRLNRFLDEEVNPVTGAFLSDRIERLERQVSELVGVWDALRGAGATPAPLPPSAKPNAKTVNDANEHSAWTIGEGRGRRLTIEGEAELLRLLDTGWTDAQIATHLGVKPFSVTAKRKRREPANG